MEECYSMERRKFIKGTALGLGGAALAAPAVAQDTKTLTIVSTWPRDFPGLGLSAQRLAARIDQLSEGRLKTEYFAAGERVGAFDVFDEVASGNSQAYIAADYYWTGKHPGFAYFTSVPFGMTTPEWNAWIKFAGGQALWDELSGEFGLKALTCGATGAQAGGWFNKEIESADEWVGPYNDYFMKFYEAAKFYYTGGMHEPGGGLAFGMNASWWGSLTDWEKAVIEAACNEEHAAQPEEVACCG